MPTLPAHQRGSTLDTYTPQFFDRNKPVCHVLTPSGLESGRWSFDVRHSLTYSKLTGPLLQFDERPIPVRNQGELPMRWAGVGLG